MKGIVIDFDELEKSGLILGEDGNRYSFELDNWKSKNKTPEIDVEVDFVVNENSASDIFCLTKNINKTSINEEKKEDKIEILSENQIFSDFKKINFDEIEKEMYSDERYKESKAKNLKILLIIIAIDFIAYFITKTDFKALGYLALFFSVPSTFIMLFVVYKLNKGDFDKKHIIGLTRDTVIYDTYAKSLTILNYIPNNLNYAVIKMISVTSDNYDNARKELVRQAYELKADGILNLKHDTNNVSKVKTSPLRAGIYTDVTTTCRIEGIAVKYI